MYYPLYSCFDFLVVFDIKVVVLQTFVEQLAIFISHHIHVQKSAVRQQITVAEHSFLHWFQCSKIMT